MANAQPELTFGTFALIPANPSGDAWTTNTTAELDFGNPEPVVAPIQSLLQDGSLAEILSYDNRSVVIRVEISGPDLGAIEDGELALMGEVNAGRNTLRWSPPDSAAHPILFDVIWSRLDWTLNDLGELRRVRTFTITLNCAPFGRDEDETVVEATGTGAAPPSPITTSIDDGSALTGWSLTTSPTSGGVFSTSGPTVVSGEVVGSLTAAAGSPAPARQTVSVTLTRGDLSESMATTPYLGIDYRAGWSPQIPQTAVKVFVNGAEVEVLARSSTGVIIDCSDIATVMSVAVRTEHLYRRSAGWVTLAVGSLYRTNVVPFVGTGRQLIRQFTVGGSARTQGSIAVEHETTALSDALVYTCSANDAGGSQPPLRQYRTAGGTVTADATTASGSKSPLNSGTPETFDIPAAAVVEGTHSLMAIVKSGTTGWKSITVTVSTLVGGVELGARSTLPFVELPTTGWTIVELGRVTLPPVALPPGSDSAVRIELSSTDAVDLDEALIFHATNGALTWVKCGTGTPAAGGASNRLWLDTATLDRSIPAAWLGTEADQSDSRHAIGVTEVGAHGAHMLEPGVVNLYTLTLGATNAAASARFFRRWQHNAGA